MLVVRRNVTDKLRIVRSRWTCRPYEVEHGSVGLENGELKVEAEGGSCLFACKNYKSFWIASVKEEGKFKENTSYKEFDGGWYLVKIEDNELKVIINRNETNASRSFTVCVEAGNAFDEFKFVQDAAKQ